MYHPNQYLSPKTQADLQQLMEPVSGYIAAVGTAEQQRVILMAALLILVQHVQEVNAAASAYVETSSQNHFG
jgi:hypothetical protein